MEKFEPPHVGCYVGSEAKIPGTFNGTPSAVRNRKTSVFRCAGARRLNQFPKLRIFLERFIFADWEAGPEQEVFERVSAQNPMHYDSQFVTLEIDPVVSNPKAVKCFPAALQFAKAFQLSADDLLRESSEFTKDEQLKFLRHACQLGCTGRIKDDLERSHFAFVEGDKSKVEGSATKNPVMFDGQT